MKTQIINLDKIKTNPDNPRTISDEKLQQLVNSIQQFPEMLELRPIVVDENMVAIGGNMRVKACKTAGVTKVPVVFANKLTPEQKHEFIIKDNVGFGEWDLDLLSGWDDDLLGEWGLDIDFSKPIQSRTDQDHIPPVDDNTISKMGDVWQLDNHPPYNVNITGAAGRYKMTT